MKELEAVNKELEDQRAQLATANEKLADDEGRWYSLARELESQLDVIKKASQSFPRVDRHAMARAVGHVVTPL